MADFPAQFPPPLVSIHDQLGPASNRAFIPNIYAGAYFGPSQPLPVPLARAPAGQISLDHGLRVPKATPATSLLLFGNQVAGPTVSTGLAGPITPEVNRRALPAQEDDRGGAISTFIPGGLGVAVGAEWFERLHVAPVRLDLGNILSTQVREIELFNAFRRPRIAVDWTTFTNNAGTGVTVTNLPGLPLTIASFDSFVAEVQITTDGPPNIEGTLDFGFGAPVSSIIAVEITGSRITIFQYRPQAGINETLEFKTDILRNNDGTEQRIRVREAPRQNIEMVVRTDDDRTRDVINSVLFDWQARVFGVPIWWELRGLGADIAVNDLTFTVDTADADYRLDSLVMIYRDNFYFEVLEIDSFTASSITVKTPFANSFSAADSLVMPIRTALTKPQLRNARFAIGPSDFAMSFQVLDNVDLADIGSFATYQGAGQTVAKPLLDDFNFMPGSQITEGIRRKVERLDVQTGPPSQYSPWAKGKPLYQFGFESISIAETWKWRQLIHYLHGSQLSFYVPTGRYEFRVLVDLGVGAASFDCTNIGFTDFVNAGNVPRSDVRILRTDGTYSSHEITSSQVLSPDVERISFTPPLGPALPVAEIERVEYLTLSRIDADKITFQHRRPGECRLSFNLLGVPA